MISTLKTLPRLNVRIERLTISFFSPDSCAHTSLILHGRQVPRLLHNHHRLFPRPNRRRLRWLLTGSLPTHWWQGPSHRGMLFQEEVDAYVLYLSIKHKYPGGQE